MNMMMKKKRNMMMIIMMMIFFKDEEEGTTTTTTVKPTADPYFTHYDPREEHDAYKKAERRFEDHHRAKVSKVMKDWSDLEEKYQDMREKDPSSAELGSF